MERPSLGKLVKALDFVGLTNLSDEQINRISDDLDYTDVQIAETKVLYKQTLRKYFGLENEHGDFHISRDEIYAFNTIFLRGKEDITMIGPKIPWYSDTKARIPYETFIGWLKDFSEKIDAEVESAKKDKRIIFRHVPLMPGDELSSSEQKELIKNIGD